MQYPRRVSTTLPYLVFSREADIDYLLARMIHFLGHGFIGRAGFFAHQACEKYMKAVMVQNTGAYLETHKLPKLASACSEFEAYFAKQSTITTLRIFDTFEQVGRYGGAANFDPLATVARGKKITAGTTLWLGHYLDLLDEFAFKITGMLGHTLKPILEDDTQHSWLLATWKGDRPLKLVLTQQNSYFKELTDC
jgi:HEPN domain-containing protein